MEVVCPTFRLPHRMEVLGSICGVTIINDSKSTNPGSAIAALLAVDQPVVLLLGGHSKGAGYEDLANVILTRAIREVVLFGEAASELSELFSRYSVGFPTVSVDRSMESAIHRGLRAALPGDVLLLSPACSSYDAFTDFAERGEAFADLIQSQPGFESSPSRT
jgi:UDP-N-acetylmuramoylalanine--D-glutamate ligase